MSKLKTIHAGQLTNVGTVQLENLGTKRYSEDGLEKYRYVKVVTVALLQGEVCYQADLATYDMFNVHNDQSVDSPQVAGVAIVTIAKNSYGWVQVGGYHPNVREDGAVALKDALIGDGATKDGEADTMAAGEEHLAFGFALGAATTFEDDNGDTLDCCKAYLSNCLFG